MTTVTETNRQVTPGPRAATQAALDVMLTDAAIEPGPAGRLVRPGPAARLGRQPRAATPAGRAACRWPRHRAGACRRRRLGADAPEGRPAIHRPRVAGELAVPAPDAELSGARRDRRRVRGRRRAGLAGRRADAFHAGQPARRDRADELRAYQPTGAQGDDRPRRRQPRPRRTAARPRCQQGAAPGDGRHEQVPARRATWP